MSDISKITTPDGTVYDIKDASSRTALGGHTVGANVPSNAKFTDTTYTFATGDANGQIKITPSGGTAQNVSVKGLASGAYTDKYAGSDSAGGPANNVKGVAGTGNTFRHIWFSDTSPETARNYDDDLKYNPNTNDIQLSAAHMRYDATTKSIMFEFD